MAESEQAEQRRLTCPGPPEHEFLVPKGRGRPPVYCSEHKPQSNPKKNNPTNNRSSEDKNENKESKVQEQTPRSRPAPGPRPAPRKAPAPRMAPRPERTWADEPIPARDAEVTKSESTSSAPDQGSRKLPPLGTPDSKSRAKAELSAERTASQVEMTQDSEAWPRGRNGKPMAKITMSASELVPTGQYANVSVGPAQITLMIDLDRAISDGKYLNSEERECLAAALNELAEVVEGDVIAVQRNLVLESIQEQMAHNGN